MFDFGEKEKKRKRTLGIRDKQILHQRAKYKCEACGKKVKFSEIQVGHKRAYSKGGSTTLRNSVCLCYKCNKLQGTDSWPVFLKKMKKEPKKRKTTGEKKASTKKAPSAKEKKTTKKTPRKKKSKKKSTFDQIWDQVN